MTHTEFLQQRGQPIPGSKLLREFCWRCDAPLRVLAIGAPAYCEECEPRQPPPGTYGPLDEDFGGYSANARMILEDGL